MTMVITKRYQVFSVTAFPAQGKLEASPLSFFAPTSRGEEAAKDL